MAKLRRNQVAGSVCLYGTQRHGMGWLASSSDGKALLGDGQLKYDGATAALWHGLLALKDAGYVGPVEVYAPGGERMAMASNARELPYYGSLEWGPANVWVIQAEDFIAAAERQKEEVLS
jgi:hypothetical protein